MDIFGYNQTVGEYGFRDDPSQGDAALTFGDTSLSLVQQWNIQYQLNVTPILECGSSKVYFAAKHSSGTMSIGRIVAEDPLEILKNIGTVCDKEKSAKLTASTTCANTTAVDLKLKHPMASSIGFSGQAQNAYVTEDVQVMFASLEV